MRVGFTVYSNRADEIVPICQRAEALGFEGAWVGDHVVSPENQSTDHPYETRVPMVLSGDERIYDHFTMIGAMLAGTSRLKVASGIYLLPLRHPLLTARACLTAHKMSGGRFRFGVGLGWLPDEFAALGVPFKDRAKRFEEILDVLPKLFAGAGPVSSDGPLYPFAPLQLTSEPAAIPLLFGGTAAPAVRRAALRGDGWYGTTIPLEECLKIREDILQIRREQALDHKPFEFVCRVVGPATRDNIERYGTVGFDHVVLPWESIHPSGQADMSLGAKLNSLSRVAKELGLSQVGVGESIPPR